MKTLSTFHTILLIVFGFAMFIGVLIFSGVIPGFRAPSSGVGGAVVVWGTVPEAALSRTLADFRDQHKSEFNLNYVVKDSRTIETELVEAQASGKGPDLVILPHTSILKQRAMLVPFPYTAYPERQFVDTFAREASLYLAPEGVLAVPIAIDPLVLYYNVDALSGAGLVSPPKLWSEMPGVVKALAVMDKNKNIQYAALPLGKANNIAHAKDILALLALQAGNPLVLSSKTESPRVVMAEAVGTSQKGTEEALAFFSRFADPLNALYTWNSSLPEAREAFVRNQAGMYLGYASEYERLQKQNPQLNFDLTLVPQVSATTQVGLGRMWGVSLTRGSRNPQTAAQVAYLLTGAEFAAGYAAGGGWAPARADLLRNLPGDTYGAVLYRAAITSRGWLEPDPARVTEIFRQMIETVQSGAKSASDALAQAQFQIQALIK
jgi:ABC-type glycerol-3-phosphate transport system substrate-binding protein